MSQKLIKFIDNGTYKLTDLIDTNIFDLSPNQMLFYNGSYWQNIDIKNFNPLIQRVKVVSDTFTAETYMTYILSVSKLGIVCYLPGNPAVGDYIEIIDKFAAIGGLGCEYGFGTFNVKIEPAPNFYIEDDEEYYLTKNGEYVKFVYIGCQTWRLIKTGSDGTGSGDGGDVITGTYVRTINNFSGDVSLNASHIPETTSRLYFNNQRFKDAAGVLDLDIFKDVSYDTLPNNNNVLTWDSSIGKWAPRSFLLNLYLNELSDVTVQYHSTMGHPVSRDFTTTELTPDEAYNLPIKTLNDSVDTGLILYQRDWVIGRQDNDLSWRVQNRAYSDQRRLLADLQDVEIELTNTYTGFATLNIGHGQVLQWDGNIHRWKPGGVVSLNSTDDLPEGQTNLYLTPESLEEMLTSQTSSIQFDLGKLTQVDDSLSNMSALTHPTTKVLGWVPASNQWEAVSALTNTANTADIDEATFVGIGTRGNISWDKHSTNRGYFTGLRVQQTLQEWGELDWVKDVTYPYGRAHGMGLVWDNDIQKWIAGYQVTATTTDDLPEGNTNLYYTDSRVSTWTYYNLKPTVNYFNDVNYTSPEAGQVLVWDPEGGWVNGFSSLMPLTKGQIVVGTSDTNPYDFQALDPGLPGQFLKINYDKNVYLEWSDLEPSVKAVLMYPDLPQSNFIRARDLNDTIIYLGTANGALAVEDFINPITSGRLSIYLDSVGLPLHHLTDRTFYNNTPSISPGVINDPLATFTSITSNLIIAFSTANAYRPERFILQAKVTGKQLFKVSVSNDLVSWDVLQKNNQDFVFEISEDMYLFQNTGTNSEIIDNDPTFELADYFLVNLPFLDESFNSSGEGFTSSFYRYIKLEPTLPTNEGLVKLYEISLYGWLNINNTIHTLTSDDINKVLTTGINNLGFLVPGSDAQITNNNLTEGFTCWVLTSPLNTALIYTADIGCIYSGSEDVYPSINSPLLIPPNSLVQLSYIGKQKIYNESNQLIDIHRWHCINLTGGTSGGLGEDIDVNYVTNRTNHYGTQDVTTITGLATVATTGNWLDLEDKPTIFDGNYNNLTNKPTLGTAASLDVGLLPSNIVQLDQTGKIPTSVINLSGISFDTPTTTKGDLIAHNGTSDVRFPIGGLDGLVLKVDSSTPTGLKWDTADSLGTNAITLNGQPDTYYLDRANHNGYMPISAITGWDEFDLSVDWTNITNKPVIGTSAGANIGTLAGNVIALSEDEILPRLDGSNLYNINSPLTTIGDIIVRGNGIDSRLARGSTNQILTVVPIDGVNPLGLAWTDLDTNITITSLNGQPASYYLDFTNHTGNIDFTNPNITTTGLSDIATSGLWSDILNKPTFLGTFDGTYNSLTGKPTLGTSAQYSVGTSPFNVVQLNDLGKIDSSLIDTNFNFISPLATKGDLMVRNNTEDDRLVIGTDDQVLIVDSTTDLGVRWADVSELEVSPALPLSTKGDLLVHNGTQLVPLSVGANNSFLVADSTAINGVKWSSNVSSALSIQGVDSAGINKYYGTNALGEAGFHSYTAGIGSPLTTKGDIYVYGPTNVALGRGTPGQYLTVDLSTETGLKWVDLNLSSVDAVTLDNQLPSYYLDRRNHTETQTLATISDAGTAAKKDAGLLAGQVLLLSEDNKLPQLDGSLLTGIQSSTIISLINSSTTLTTIKNRLVLLDSSLGSLNITLPASPNEGDIIIFSDYAGSNYLTPTGLGLNSVTLFAHTNHNIQGYQNITLDDENTSVSIVFNSNRWAIYSASF